MNDRSAAQGAATFASGPCRVADIAVPQRSIRGCDFWVTMVDDKHTFLIACGTFDPQPPGPSGAALANTKQSRISERKNHADEFGTNADIADSKSVACSGLRPCKWYQLTIKTTVGPFETAIGNMLRSYYGYRSIVSSSFCGVLTSAITIIPRRMN